MRRLIKEVARFMVVGVSGTVLTDEEETLLRKYPPAGVILFSRNVSNPRQLRKLTGKVRSTIKMSSGKVPIICADHEGGRISVLAKASSVPPSQMAVGRCLDPSLCKEVFAETALIVGSLGVNTVLSPVADINSNIGNQVIGTRSFGEAPELVASFTSIAIDALGANGVVSCAKHFPGHGASSSDSHRTLPCIPHKPEEMERFELVPFREAVSRGVPMIMVGHLTFKGGGDVAASMDEEVVEGWLRRRLAFEGVVITDALEMKGALVRSVGRVGEVADSPDDPEVFIEQLARALSSGNDLLLYSDPVEIVYGRLERALGLDDDRVRNLNEKILKRKRESKRRVNNLRLMIEKFNMTAGDTGAVDGGSPDDGPHISGPERNGGDAMEHGEGVNRVGAFIPDSYYRAARMVIDGQEEDVRIFREGFAGAGVRFFGEAEEFLNPVVKEFVTQFCNRLGILGGDGGRNDVTEKREQLSLGESREELTVEDRKYPWIDYSRVGTVKRFKPKDSPGGRTYVELSAGGGASKKEIVVLVNRKPVGREMLQTLIGDESFVIVAGWPYARESIPRGVPSIVTYDVYDGLIQAIFGS